MNVFYPTYLSHEGSQAVNKQIGLSVVHQSSLFQVGTYLYIKMTHHHTPYSDRLGSRASGVPEDTHLRKKHPALNSWRQPHEPMNHWPEWTPAPSSVHTGHGVWVSVVCVLFSRDVELCLPVTQTRGPEHSWPLVGPSTPPLSLRKREQQEKERAATVNVVLFMKLTSCDLHASSEEGSLFLSGK